MPSECAHATCSNLLVKGNNISFHRFPKHPERRRRWTFLMRRREGWSPQPWDLVCGKHFRTEDFDRTGQTIRLRHGVEPSIFDIPQHLQKTTKLRKTVNSTKSQAVDIDDDNDDGISVDEVEMEIDFDEGTCCQTTSAVVAQSFHTYAGTEESIKDKWFRAERRADEAERKLRNALQREKRTKLTVKNLIEDLKEKNILTDELQSKLDGYADFPVHLFNKTTAYTAEQQQFAMTLHLYGPKAYEYLAQKVNLPSTRTLRRWLSKTDGTAGLNSTMLQALKEKVSKDPSTYTDVALMLDAMAIKKLIIYDNSQKKMTGFVDLGNNEVTEDEATEALVFMVVGFKGHWKAPIAHYLTRTVSAPTQKELVVHALHALHDIGMRVWTITMDGHGTNQSMCRLLGCNISVDDCSPKFQHPAEPSHEVFIMFDPCHMLKLFRNLLGAYGVISSPQGKIEWQYINRLQSLQDDAGLRLANRLSLRHIMYSRQIMKVNLAAQTLSSSVASALQCLHDVGHPEFKDVKATIEFIQVIDHLFDVFNSRNAVARGYKSALREGNWPHTNDFLTSVKVYLCSLKTADGTFLSKSKRHTAVTGFVVAITALQDLVPRLLSVTQTYILTYKFSQDHVELFFNAIRRAGGWNNNPHTQQFRTAFRKLLMHSGAIPVSSGNVVEQDSTVCVPCSTLSPDLMVSKDITEEDDPFIVENQIFTEHDYAGWAQHTSLVDNATGYIAGWVVRKVLPKLQCDICRECLLTVAMPQHQQQLKSYQLIRVRNNGGLVIPSTGTVAIVQLAERAIQRLMNIHSVKKLCKFPRVLMLVREMLSDRDVFNLSNHIVDTQHGIDNHFTTLLYNIVETYYNLRQHHIAKMFNIKRQAATIRQTVNKLVLFKGQ